MLLAAVSRTAAVVAVAALALAAAAPRPARAQAEIRTDRDVERLFATTCGYCHQGAGREEGRGPRLMGTTRDDDYLANRIATGRPGKMPAYGRSLTVEQIEAIIRYIRGLKPGDGG